MVSESHETLHKFPNPEKERQRFNLWVTSIGGDILGLENDHYIQISQSVIFTLKKSVSIDIKLA